MDDTYNGNYANVKVTDNTIQGRKLFGSGIAIGACTWSGPCRSPYFYKGPTTVTGNKLSGNISFAIPINGWSNGLTVCVIYVLLFFKHSTDDTFRLPGMMPQELTSLYLRTLQTTHALVQSRRFLRAVLF